MRVKLPTLDLGEYARRAINAHYGQPGRATHEDIRQWAVSMIDAAIEDLCYQLDLAEEARGDG